jgi:hypothetical protein
LIGISFQQEVTLARASAEAIDKIDLQNRIALSDTRPSGSLSNSILSPGRMPRCSSTSLRNVTCPRAVTVGGHGLESSFSIAMQKCITGNVVALRANILKQ